MAYIKMSSFHSKQSLVGDEMIIGLDSRNIKISIQAIKDYIQTGDVFSFRGNINSGSLFPGLDGIYVPTESGTYVNFGNIVVDLSQGLTLISKDQNGFEKILIPINLAGYATVESVEALYNVSVEDNFFNIDDALVGQFFNLSTGEITNNANNLSLKLSVSRRMYLVQDNGTAFSFVEFGSQNLFLRQGTAYRSARGFEFTPSPDAVSVGLNLVADGVFSRPVKVFAIEGFPRIETGNAFGARTSPLMFLDKDNQGLLIKSHQDTYTDSLGRRKYVEPVGINTSWTFDGSLAVDQVSKSSVLQSNIISETYSSGSGYRVNVGAIPAAGGLAYLLVDKENSLNSLQFSREVLEFQILRKSPSGRVSILYAGQTIHSRKLAHGFLFTVQHASSGNGLISIQEKTNISAASWVNNNFYNTGVVFNENDFCRLIHTFNGRSHTLEVFRLEGGDYVSKGSVSYSYGPCEQRPSNRKYAIELSDIEVLITRFDTYSHEPYRVRLMMIGDSIQSGFSCTDFENAYSRKATRWNGIAGSVRSAHGNTTDDFLLMLPEILERRPEKVVIALGLNDVRYGVADYQAQYQSIVTQLEAVGSEVILCNLIPNNVDDVLPFNAWQQSTFGATNAIVDMYTPMDDPNNPGQLNPAYHTDGTHPNNLGSEVMFQTLKPYL